MSAGFDRFLAASGDAPLLNKSSKEVEERRYEVTRRIASGDKIAGIQVRNQQAQRVWEVTQDQALSREGRSR